MQQRLDTDRLVEQARGLAKEIRASEAYPAIMGAVAGGIAGAMMAALIASRFADRGKSDSPKARRSEQAGFNMREIVQFLGVVAGLVKQAREWYAHERRS
jgi:hypothetical protein